MKSKRFVFLALIFAATPLLARRLPTGTAGGRQEWRDPRIRQLSHSIATTRVPVSIFGCGTATIDGVLSPGEWSGAGTEIITVNTPAGPVPGTLFVMNDNLNLYVAFKFIESVANYGSLGVEFDNNNNGVPFEEGDDALVANNQLGFFDDYRTMLPPCTPGDVCGLQDTEGGGTSDGASAYHNDGAFSVYEISHPLNSLDAGHDFALGPGMTVGFFIELRIIDANGNIYDTDYPGFGIYDQFIVSGCIPLVSACGTPTLDGIISPGEWPAGGQYRLSVRTPHRGTTPATFYVMNDSFNLYTAISFDQPALLAGNDFSVTFDIDNNGLLSVGDDLITYDSVLGFHDLVYIPCGAGGSICNDYDTNHGGTNDGAGALANNGTVTAYELSHPLNSGDVNDIALSWVYPNNVINYSFFLQMVDSGFVFPDDFGQMQSAYKPLLICTPSAPQSVRDLGQRINSMAASGILNKQNGDALRKDISKASENLQAGKTKQAGNDLGNFISDVQKMVRKGELNDKLAQPLIAAANNAISQL